jgi:predicted RND superfamily exporter protein
MNYVTINEDLTEYLPNDSAMRTGLNIMEKEFPKSVETEGFKIMLKDLSEEQKETVEKKLAEYDGVESVEYDIESKDYNKDGYSLFIVNTTYTDTDKTTALLNKIETELKKDYTVHTYYVNASDSVLDLLLPVALGIFLLILVLLSKSYIEVFLLLAGIGFAIIINMGTNIIFPSVSDMTLSIASILQLVLSIDYSIMMFHRYEQERNLLDGKDNVQAMKNAIKNIFSSVSSSAFTTIVGLLMLLFMSYTIGMDMGLVMAKGILCSLICVFTVMPTLILWCDKLLKKTNKAYIREKMKSKKEAKKNA